MPASRTPGSCWRAPAARRAGVAAEVEALRLLFYRVGSLMQAGEMIGHESAMAKVMADELGQKLALFANDLLGPFASLSGSSPWTPLDGAVPHAYLTSLGHT